VTPVQQFGTETASPTNHYQSINGTVPNEYDVGDVSPEWASARNDDHATPRSSFTPLSQAQTNYTSIDAQFSLNRQ
jgi:hypothetical protein